MGVTVARGTSSLATCAEHRPSELESPLSISACQAYRCDEHNCCSSSGLLCELCLAELASASGEGGVAKIAHSGRAPLLVLEAAVRILVSTDADFNRVHIGFDPDYAGKYTQKKRAREARD